MSDPHEPTALPSASPRRPRRVSFIWVIPNRVLVAELSQRLPQSNMLGEIGGVSAAPDATIELNMQRLDEDTTGVVVLQAQAGVSFKGHAAPVLRSFHLTVPPSGPGVPDEVAAITVAVGQLADGLASILLAGPAAP